MDEACSRTAYSADPEAPAMTTTEDIASAQRESEGRARARWRASPNAAVNSATPRRCGPFSRGQPPWEIWRGGYLQPARLIQRRERRLKRQTTRNCLAHVAASSRVTVAGQRALERLSG